MGTKQAKKTGTADQLRRAVRDSGQSLYAVGKGSGIDYSLLSRFMKSERGMNFDTAARLIEYLGLELRPSRKGG